MTHRYTVSAAINGGARVTTEASSARQAIALAEFAYNALAASVNAELLEPGTFAIIRRPAYLRLSREPRLKQFAVTIAKRERGVSPPVA